MLGLLRLCRLVIFADWTQALTESSITSTPLCHTRPFAVGVHIEHCCRRFGGDRSTPLTKKSGPSWDGPHAGGAYHRVRCGGPQWNPRQELGRRGTVAAAGGCPSSHYLKILFSKMFKYFLNQYCIYVTVSVNWYHNNNYNALKVHQVMCAEDVVTWSWQQKGTLFTLAGADGCFDC